MDLLLKSIHDFIQWGKEVPDAPEFRARLIANGKVHTFDWDLDEDDTGDTAPQEIFNLSIEYKLGNGQYRPFVQREMVLKFPENPSYNEIRKEVTQACVLTFEKIFIAGVWQHFIATKAAVQPKKSNIIT